MHTDASTRLHVLKDSPEACVLRHAGEVFKIVASADAEREWTLALKVVSRLETIGDVEAAGRLGATQACCQDMEHLGLPERMEQGVATVATLGPLRTACKTFFKAAPDRPFTLVTPFKGLPIDAAANIHGPEHLLAMFYDVALGLRGMEAARVVHCDVKTDNCLVGLHDGVACLIDFGVSVDLDNAASVSSWLHGIMVPSFRDGFVAVHFSPELMALDVLNQQTRWSMHSGYLDDLVHRCTANAARWEKDASRHTSLRWLPMWAPGVVANSIRDLVSRVAAATRNPRDWLVRFAKLALPKVDVYGYGACIAVTITLLETKYRRAIPEATKRRLLKLVDWCCQPIDARPTMAQVVLRVAHYLAKTPKQNGPKGAD
jgi:hypothetical protein